MGQRLEREEFNTIILIAMKLGKEKMEDEKDVNARITFYWSLLREECNGLQLQQAINAHFKHVSKFMPAPNEIMEQLKTIRQAAKWQSPALPAATPRSGEFPMRKWLGMTDEQLAARGLSEGAIRFVREWGNGWRRRQARRMRSRLRRCGRGCVSGTGAWIWPRRSNLLKSGG